MACHSCRLHAQLLARTALRASAGRLARPAQHRAAFTTVIDSGLGPRYYSQSRPQHAAADPGLPNATSTPSSPTPAAPSPETQAPSSSKFLGGVAGALRTFIPKQMGQYMVLNGIEQLYKVCSAPAMYSIPEKMRKDDEVPQTDDGEEIGVAEGPWLQVFDLLPTFSAWSQVTMMHMYIVVARIRCLDRETAKLWQHQFIDQYFFDCERMMHINHGMTSGALRQRYLKDIFVQWRGLIAAYDEGVARGDMVLASAVWRNLFKGREDVDFRQLAAVVAWLRASLRDVEELADEDLIAFPRKVFVRDIQKQFALVDELSPRLPKDLPAGVLGGQPSEKPMVSSEAKKPLPAAAPFQGRKESAAPR